MLQYVFKVTVTQSSSCSKSVEAVGVWVADGWFKPSHRAQAGWTLRRGEAADMWHIE